MDYLTPFNGFAINSFVVIKYSLIVLIYVLIYLEISLCVAAAGRPRGQDQVDTGWADRSGQGGWVVG